MGSPFRSRKALGLLGALTAGMFALSACGDAGAQSGADEKSDSLQVVTSFSILEEMVEEIGGDHVQVHNLVPIGTDPHEYEPLPEDLKAFSNADLVFYNGLNLEGDTDEGWLARLAESTSTPGEKLVETSTGIEPRYLHGEDGTESQANPHVFLDPILGIKMAQNVTDTLIETDPENADYYEERSGEFIQNLEEIDGIYREKIGSIPKENRILVTSERAYQYMAATYGLEEGYLWAIDTEENGSPEQLNNLIYFLEEHPVTAVFVESNVDSRPMETVSEETGIPIGGILYSDEIGTPDSPADTYANYLLYNIDTIYEALAE